ncbi:biotin-dependent carboxyltransferase family protein [Pseudalkalibacillus decolorationis]|uniref:5-oxoprolinase subunit C family protein n=1 Tax=Pseudalkalibacillus decolorationis TaxID=163879 RepID=UPI002147A671|nr:biotin-dependent carboxyltransferase family protein [Pseudalkalibacillus decolorationis]
MITILQPGLFSTVQDIGRIGYQKFSVPVSGAVDLDAHRMANLLVGNDEHFATIEMTVQAAEMKFEQDRVIAIFGEGPNLSLNGKHLPKGKPIFLPKDSTVKHAATGSGARTYLAVAGGIDVPVIMDSRSTYTRAAIGGFEGRRLAKGDQIGVGEMTLTQRSILTFLKEKDNVSWFVPTQFFDSNVSNGTIQMIKSEQFNTFTKESQEAVFNRFFTVTSQSDRMGYRLDGVELKQIKAKNEISSAVPFGTIQVPPDGNPILLAADRQTTGGYPVIGYTASVDRHKLAQLKPGDQIHFELVDIGEAQQQFATKEEAMRHVKAGIKLQLKGMN